MVWVYSVLALSLCVAPILHAQHSSLSTTAPVWFSRERKLDLTGDHRADRVVLVAVGAHPESLQVTLTAVINGKRYPLGSWDSSYELIDPPFGSPAPRAVVDSFLRARFNEELDQIGVRIGQVTIATIEGGGGGCDEALADCLRSQWGLTTIEGKDAAAELLRKPVPLIDLAYGYETTMIIAWVESLHRFLTVASCC